MLEQLREEVWKCNLELPKNGLVRMTSGNVSGRDPEINLVVIKPSGYKFEDLTPADLVVVDLEEKIARAIEIVTSLADRLGLERSERRSYLELLLEANGK